MNKIKKNPQIEELIREKSFKTAIDLIDTTLKNSPNNFHLYYYKSLSEAGLLNYQTAIELSLKAKDLDKKNTYPYDDSISNYYVKIGDIELNKRNIKDAESIYYKSLESNESFVPGLHSIATIEFLKNNLDKAEELFNKAIKINNKFYISYLGLANVNNKKGDFKKAVDCCKKAISLQPNHFESNYLLATTYFNNKDYSSAIEAFRNSQLIKPDHIELNSSLIKSLIYEKKFDDAYKVINTLDKSTIVSSKSLSSSLLFLNKNIDNNDTILIKEPNSIIHKINIPSSIIDNINLTEAYFADDRLNIYNTHKVNIVDMRKLDVLMNFINVNFQTFLDNFFSKDNLLDKYYPREFGLSCYHIHSFESDQILPLHDQKSALNALILLNTDNIKNYVYKISLKLAESDNYSFKTYDHNFTIDQSMVLFFPSFYSFQIDTDIKKNKNQYLICNFIPTPS